MVLARKITRNRSQPPAGHAHNPEGKLSENHRNDLESHHWPQWKKDPKNDRNPQLTPPGSVFPLAWLIRRGNKKEAWCPGNPPRKALGPSGEASG